MISADLRSPPISPDFLFFLSSYASATLIGVAIAGTAARPRDQEEIVGDQEDASNCYLRGGVFRVTEGAAEPSKTLHRPSMAFHRLPTAFHQVAEGAAATLEHVIIERTTATCNVIEGGVLYSDHGATATLTSAVVEGSALAASNALSGGIFHLASGTTATLRSIVIRGTTAISYATSAGVPFVLAGGDAVCYLDGEGTSSHDLP